MNSIRTIRDAAQALISDRDKRRARWRGVIDALPAGRVRAALESGTQDGVRRALRDCLGVVVAAALPSANLVGDPAQGVGLTPSQALSVVGKATDEDRLGAVRRAVRHDVAGGVTDREAAAAIYRLIGSATRREAATFGLWYTVDAVPPNEQSTTASWTWTGFVPEADGGRAAAAVARSAQAQGRPVPAGALLRVKRCAVNPDADAASNAIGTYRLDGSTP